MIKRFKEVSGLYIEKIYGQDRLAFGMTDTTDMYDLIELSKHGGYQGSVIRFYDFETGEVYTPFEQKRDVVYSKPAYSEGFYYFLQGDYGHKKVTLYKYLPEKEPEAVAEFSTDQVDLYNLQIMGEKVHVVSQDCETFRCYYPVEISFHLESQDTVTLVTDDRVIIERWVEEGWDHENDCRTDQYRFYNKVILKDFSGNVISEEIGALYQAPDGTLWMA